MDLLILGAGARAAAFSALRLGLRPACADLFADADLAAACPSTRIESRRLSRRPGHLRGEAPADSVALHRRDREPARAGRPDLPSPQTPRQSRLDAPTRPRSARARRSRPGRGPGRARAFGATRPESRPTARGWSSRSPRAAGGGFAPGRVIDPSPRNRVYFQERVDGLPLAVLFVGDGTGARCLGITRQFVGRPGNRFAYRGSLGPWPVGSEVRRQIETLGRTIAGSFGLFGLFGIDLIVRDGQPWPIEVNPRYTASVEVLEWALGRSLLAEHLRAFGLGVENPPIRASISPQGFVGKAILHADRTGVWRSTGESSARPGRTDFRRSPTSRPGTGFQPGDPVLTVFAQGDLTDECRREAGPARGSEAGEGCFER